MSDVVQKTRTKRKEIWVNEPKEAKEALIASRGTGDSSFFTALYANDETRTCHDVLYTIRQTVIGNNVDLKTIERTTSNLLTMYLPFMKWSKLHDTEKLFKEVAENLIHIESKEEFLALLEELILYVGRLNYWLDQGMPWYDLVQTYDSAMHQNK